ncbi:hypothetical protein Moror_1433 [Moniliophthora roreri MCA 2997]|uniref:Uncharacterized protein n=2 Tax=Moniliophthora roreri TaxID=221103 RepID=V2XMM4_MONRO|nr:hypothetical protein Moror_1433 [Moniliophthora roreri MCA 2997]KAI3596802.1 hypothetical protein WG66_016421 [Moniliophthora roreri]
MSNILFNYTPTMIIAIVNTFSMAFITGFIFFTLLGLVAFISWLRHDLQSRQAQQIVDALAYAPEVKKQTACDTPFIIEVSESDIEESLSLHPTPSESFSTSSDMSSRSRLRKVKFFGRNMEEATQSMKKLSHRISRSVRPALGRTSTLSKQTTTILTINGVSTSSKCLKALRSVCKVKKSSSATKMVRDIPNGHCKQIHLSEEMLGMSRPLSSNHAICTGW